MAVDREPGDDAGSADSAPDELLARAAGTLREITDDGWVRARSSVLDRVRRTLRPAPHVTGQHAGGTFTVATPVVVDRVRHAVDRATTARVLDVRVEVGAGARLDVLALRLSVAYGTSVTRTADAARVACAAEVERVLGTPFGPDRVAVDVHIADVHRQEPDGV